jgi:hypothetical protein
MAKVRKVLRNAGSGMWGYIELDEQNDYIRAVGSMEFPDKESAEDYAKGFAPDSYEYVENKESEKKQLKKLIKKAEDDIKAWKAKIKELEEPEPESLPKVGKNEKPAANGK